MALRSFIGPVPGPDDLWAANQFNRASEGFCAPGMGILGDCHTLDLDGQMIAEANKLI